MAFAREIRFYLDGQFFFFFDFIATGFIMYSSLPNSWTVEQAYEVIFLNVIITCRYEGILKFVSCVGPAVFVFILVL